MSRTEPPTVPKLPPEHDFSQISFKNMKNTTFKIQVVLTKLLEKFVYSDRITSGSSELKMRFTVLLFFRKD